MTLILLMSLNSNAQSPVASTLSDVLILADPDSHLINIEVKQGPEISNLLVIVVDNKGHTVFLDDKSHFKGVYRNQVSLDKEVRGEFELKIIADKEEISKKLVMR